MTQVDKTKQNELATFQFDSSKLNYLSIIINVQSKYIPCNIVKLHPHFLDFLWQKLAKSRQNCQWQEVAKVAKRRQSGKESLKWQKVAKVAKSCQSGLQL